MTDIAMVLLLAGLGVGLAAMIAIIVTCAIMAYVEVWYYKNDKELLEWQEQGSTQSGSSSESQQGSISGTDSANLSETNEPDMCEDSRDDITYTSGEIVSIINVYTDGHALVRFINSNYRVVQDFKFSDIETYTVYKVDGGSND